MTTQLRILNVPTEQLSVSPINVRQDVGDISELAESIRGQGILEPLRGRRVSDDHYEIIIGSRRLAAAKQLGLSFVPLIVHDISDTDAIVQSLVENIQRGDLTLEERVQAYKNLEKLEPSRFGTPRGLSMATGRSSSRISSDYDAYEAIVRLRPRGIEVKRNIPTSSPERRAGQAIPESHATLLEQAITSVRTQIPEDRADSVYEELAKVIAPLAMEQARRVLDHFKMYPDNDIADISARALATVRRDVTVTAEDARFLEEFASERGQSNWGDAISELIESAQAPPQLEVVPLPQPNLPTMSGGTVEPNESDGQLGGRQPSQPSLPTDIGGHLELGESDRLLGNEPMSPPPIVENPSSPSARSGRGHRSTVPTGEQQKNKVVWNLRHSHLLTDFYTTGYERRSLEQFIEILQAADIGTVIDIRHNPVSQYKPTFSSTNLKQSLSEHNIQYVHRGDLGVPSEIRKDISENGTRDSIWEWYKDNVLKNLPDRQLAQIIEEHSKAIVFLCLEEDPTVCHRHLLFEALERQELKGFDL